MSTKAPASSPLAFLQTHFEALKPRTVKVKGFPFDLVFEPLNAEQTFKYVQAANSKVPTEQARLFAELLVETVKLTDGKPAFPLEQGGPNPVVVLATKTPPAIFSAMAKELAKEAPTKAAEETAKK